MSKVINAIKRLSSLFKGFVAAITGFFDFVYQIVAFIRYLFEYIGGLFSQVIKVINNLPSFFVAFLVVILTILLVRLILSLV